MSTRKLTFGQYMESRTQLHNAIHRVPVAEAVYNVTKYCAVVSEHDGDSETIKLKPKHQIKVVWEYFDPKSPTPKSVTLLTNNTDLNIPWSDAKFHRWLNTNTVRERLI